MGIELHPGEAAFRCNLVHVSDGRMIDYSSAHIPSAESHPLLEAVAAELSSPQVRFYPGVSYRHICVIAGVPEVLQARCVPPHDIPGKSLDSNLPSGVGSAFLRDLMERSRPILQKHPINRARRHRGECEANMIWLFWGGATVPDMPTYQERFGLRGAISSGVDLLNGLGKLAHLDILQIPGVTDGSDNDYRGQVEGCLAALEDHDLVVIHVESPDEEGHAANVGGKIKAIERIDSEMVSRIRDFAEDLRLLAMPDHATPIAKRTHVHDPAPFLLYGPGLPLQPAPAFNERECAAAMPAPRPGHLLIDDLLAA
jgi:2,3-bisphosphoglycerate-independent phosphoglycerate mutase